MLWLVLFLLIIYLITSFGIFKVIIVGVCECVLLSSREEQKKKKKWHVEWL